MRKSDLPDPEHYGATLSSHLSQVRSRVKKVQFDRKSLYGCPLLNAIREVAS